MTLDDVEVIVELDEVAGRIEKSVKSVVKKDWFKIGDRFFLYPSFHHIDLIDRVEGKYHTGHFTTLATLYVLDAENQCQALDKLPGVAKLLKYSKSLKASVREVERVLEQEFGFEDSGDGGKEESSTHWEICCVLSREVGGSPDEWSKASPAKVDSAIKTVNDKIDAEAKAMGTQSGPPKETPKLLAIAEFRNKLKELEASWLVA